MKGSWHGKIIGGFCGSVVGGTFGALIGIIIGHLFDTMNPHELRKRRQNSQSVFFNTTFLIMGYVSKADGQVSENEIRVAERIMNNLGLSTDRRKIAIQLFNRGKQAKFNLDEILKKFQQQCSSDYDLLNLFLDIQLKAAYADGHVVQSVKQILQDIARFLNLGYINFNYYDALFATNYTHNYQEFDYQTNYQQKQRQQQQANNYSTLDTAYATLNINHHANIAEIKMAYRRLMNQNHPDKLISKGLPEEMILAATQKTQQIKAAYDQIRKHCAF